MKIIHLLSASCVLVIFYKLCILYFYNNNIYLLIKPSFLGPKAHLGTLSFKNNTKNMVFLQI